MITVREPGEYGITRADIFAEARDYSKTELFRAAVSVLNKRIYQEVRLGLEAAAESYVTVHGEAFMSEDMELWSLGLQEALCDVTPEPYQGHVSEHYEDTPMAAILVAGSATNAINQDFSKRPGAFLSRFGLVASDYEGSTVAETVAQDVREAEILAAVGATREEVSTAWRQFSQATEYDLGDLAKRYGVSRSTLSNYGSGKTPAKCNPEQARVMIDECRTRSALLAAAADVFERVR